MSDYRATYSPEDNKLRLYSRHRLSEELYQRLSAIGFKYAPKQKLFVAPMWTPAREDFLLAMCGEIGDDDTSLVARAEMRADRFDDYQESRTRDGEAACDAVHRITQNIPLGQPILIGHHSEKRARKDVERIENNMRRAVNAWESAEYWKERAQGAKAHAEYTERADVRYRRIKRLEADRRKYEKTISTSESSTTLWNSESLTLDAACAVAAGEHIYVKSKDESFGKSLHSIATEEGADLERIRQFALRAHAKTIVHCARWLAHVKKRIAYECAMSDEAGGLISERFQIEIGGRVLVGDEWLVVSRINRAGERVNSLTTNTPSVRYRIVQIEEVKDYQAPESADVAAASTASKLPPIVNFPSDEFWAMTHDDWKTKRKDDKRIRRIAATPEHGAHRVRLALSRDSGYEMKQVHITDARRIDRPSAASPAPQRLPAENYGDC